MPQRFESTGSQDAMAHAVAWPTLEDGTEVEFPSQDLWPEQALILIEEYRELSEQPVR